MFYVFPFCIYRRFHNKTKIWWKKNFFLTIVALIFRLAYILLDNLIILYYAHGLLFSFSRCVCLPDLFVPKRIMWRNVSFFSSFCVQRSLIITCLVYMQLFGFAVLASWVSNDKLTGIALLRGILWGKIIDLLDLIQEYMVDPVNYPLNCIVKKKSERRSRCIWFLILFWF